MKLIDTHAHLYLDNFKQDIGAVMDRAWAAGVEAVYLPAIDRSEHENLFALEAAYPDKCLAMMGLHPCYVKADWEEEMAAVEDWLGRRSFAAVGEIGLDFYWDRSFETQQYLAFRRQLELAKHYEIPVSIHSRNATRECLDVVASLQDGRLRGVFHCFSGDAEMAREAVDLGFYLGIGGVVTYKNGGLEPAVKAVGVEHLVLETDAPYLSPVPYRGKRNEPAWLQQVAEKLGDILEMPALEIGEKTSANACRLFKKGNKQP